MQSRAKPHELRISHREVLEAMVRADHLVRADPHRGNMARHKGNMVSQVCMQESARQ